MSAFATQSLGADVRLTVFLHGLRLDYRAHRTAAERFLQEWTAHHGTHTAAVLREDPAGLPRLPCEGLYLYG
ncbi:hypothetical protein [Nocardia sp. NBC_01329]|uniref:hypothetical protein n=1 Tax=Nocardia sp. NBC_01329 TaxID=2903594 RepID=UPI002E0F905B|nr:hypothetical protein OG405_04345 [Nocardia sp. NBC_01329]